MTRRNILILSPHGLSSNLAGPAIRFWEFARVLSRFHNVTLAAANVDGKIEADFNITIFTSAKLRSLVEESDAVIVQGFLVAQHRILQTLNVPLVVDLYDPYPIEDLCYLPGTNLGYELYGWSLTSLLLQCMVGDFFLCASERQRDFWLGVLLAMGRINPETILRDASLKNLLQIVPFGLPSEPPVKTASRLKGVYPGITSDDRVILWAGGIYDWLDPVTAIEAMQKIAAIRTDVKLFFMGTAYPTGTRVSQSVQQHAIDLATKLGLKDRLVFFNPTWVEYKDRQNYLLEADIGLITHKQNIETRLSFRTRMLDYIWAGLPIISSGGDSFSELIAEFDLGKIVPSENPSELKDAILEILESDNRESYRRRAKAVAQTFLWDSVLSPLVDFCANPHKSPDRKFLQKSFMKNFLRSLKKNPRLVKKGFLSLREEGWAAFLQRANRYWKHRS